MKAVALYSGGLDSLLAIKLIQKQGIEVIAVAFRSPFFVTKTKMLLMKETAKKEGFKTKFIEMDEEYLEIVRNPVHGHGKNMNPCIDCHTHMIKKAAEYAKKIKAAFVFTGEVLNERPMSQNKQSLDIVAKQAGLSGKLLRPLSAKLLEETEAEKKRYVKREELMDIQGRSRKKQIKLAKEFGIENYETPAGGCLLTCKGYSNKLKDLLENEKKATIKDIEILKFGRHFRYGKNKIIVGRNKEDNEKLLKMKAKEDYVFEAKNVMGPITLLQGPKTKKIIETAAGLTARYSDAEKEEVTIKYENKEIIIEKIKDNKNLIH